MYSKAINVIPPEAEDQFGTFCSLHLYFFYFYRAVNSPFLNTDKKRPLYPPFYY